MIRRELPSIEFNKGVKDFKSFLHEYAKIVWGFKQSKKPDAGKEFVNELKELIPEKLKDVEKFLYQQKFKKKYISETPRLLRRGVSLQI